jgi:hypothetical protein
MKKKSTRRKPKVGRPPLPLEKRWTRRINVRVYREDDDALARICAALDVNEGEATRRALRTYAASLPCEPPGVSPVTHPAARPQAL